MAKYLKNFSLYKNAKIYVTSIDMEHPEWDYGKNKGDEQYYHTTLHIQECNMVDLAIREHNHDYYDLNDKNLLKVAWWELLPIG